MNFQDLGLPGPILKALADEGYEVPTPIQGQAIPVVLGGRDLLGIAQTGTGKTAAFALPILARLDADRRPAPRRGCRALILSPTRELASQIAASFKTYGRHMGFRVAVVFGGVSMRAQIEALSRGVDILVATPGRLIDHMDSRNAVLSGTEIFVLDEADQMLDLGFFRPIRKIVATLSARRQNLFFSATMPAEISKLADELLQDPVKVAVAPVATTAERVSQRIIHVEHAGKRQVLVDLFADPALARTLVFTRTKRGADRVAEYLDKAGIKAAAIHGNKSQRQREDALDSFKRGDIRVLVATDIAARGIDIDSVSHVVNFELPEVPEAYVHRIGRTARAGASGEAISLCDGEEVSLLRAIERLTRQPIAAEDRRSDQTTSLDEAASERRGRSAGRGRGREQRSGDRRAHGRDRSEREGRGRFDRRGDDRRDSHRRPEGNGERIHSDAPRSADRPQRDARGDRPRPPRFGDDMRAERPHRDGDARPHRDGEQSRGPRREERSNGERGERRFSRPGEHRNGDRDRPQHRDERRPAGNRDGEGRRSFPDRGERREWRSERAPSRDGEQRDRPASSTGDRAGRGEGGERRERGFEARREHAHRGERGEGRRPHGDRRRDDRPRHPREDGARPPHTAESR